MGWRLLLGLRSIGRGLLVKEQVDARSLQDCLSWGEDLQELEDVVPLSRKRHVWHERVPRPARQREGLRAGMLMKHSMDDYAARDGAQKHRQRMLLTAGGRDDVYLPANQAEAKKWLIEQGMQVTFKLFEELNHGDHNKEEMAFIRSACTREFLKADSETKRSVQRMCSQEVVLQRAPSQLWAGQKRKPTPTAAAGSAASAATASPRASPASGKRRRASRGSVDPAPERVGAP
mmetsp:Transcript_25368/g.84797  ORF Transcript_25368/g.84797 Transcript_25368/m.84797 type:complete len:233 (+) Transcript_25368:708-1406(+)